MDPSRCVVLVPVNDYIEPGCAEGLAELERLGYPVWRIYGCSAIDQARSQIATDALAAGFDELMWIDADVRFHPEAVGMLRSHDLPLVCGIYPKKRSRELVCSLLPGTEQIIFGEGGGTLEIRYAAGGFLLTKRSVYETIAEQEKLPVCNEQFGRANVPYFLPLIVPDGENHWYLGEDFAFCERARRCGFTIHADTRFRLEHIGKYGYTWEDAGSGRNRYSSYEFNFNFGQRSADVDTAADEQVDADVSVDQAS
ncbi:hypothetical protein OHB12_34230 [Nocardia sp. NBC_01730]|uniref:hypothetical protein n=1 Tax=Nocardia sp. NBC_01730 TaxID=2975998 RepID=UPI002E14795A|nr:hypothetical protein OHB12_34230 [Nocardia sp. NBC_01730]